MATRVFYLGDYDCTMAQDIIADDPDVYIEKYHYVGSGVYSIETGGTSKLTPSTSPTWVADDYISTYNNNLIVMDDNGVVATAKITDNDTDSVTFDETACLLESDETTAASFTAGSSYCFYVLTPAPRVSYGCYWGQVKGAELTINSEYKKYVSRDPQELIYKDLQSRMMELTIPYIEKASEDFYDLLGLQTYGSQTSQAKWGVGAQETDNNYYRLTFVGPDKNNRNSIVVARKLQFDMSGNWWNKDDSGHFAQPLHADALADQFYPKRARYLSITREDS